MKSFLFFLCGAAALFMITSSQESQVFSGRPDSQLHPGCREGDYLGANHLLMPGPKSGRSRVPSHSSRGEHADCSPEDKTKKTTKNQLHQTMSKYYKYSFTYCRCCCLSINSMKTRTRRITNEFKATPQSFNYDRYRERKKFKVLVFDLGF